MIEEEPKEAGATQGETPTEEERIMMRLEVHLASPSHGMVFRDGPKPRRERGHVPRVARLLALAHHFQALIKQGVFGSQTDLAQVAGLTRARITQIMNLLFLAPEIQEEILFLPRVTKGREAVTERDLREVLKTHLWSEQRVRWEAIRQEDHGVPQAVALQHAKNTRPATHASGCLSRTSPSSRSNRSR